VEKTENWWENIGNWWENKMKDKNNFGVFYSFGVF